MAEDVGALLQKGLSEWWTEETEYVFQRIERWAAYARGYNRLRSQRLSRGRMTMQGGGQDPRWSVSSSKLIIDDVSWSPRFHTFNKSRRKSRPEETKINCCGTFNYQSNSNLDSTCLETYRYDHSIYFKTIGDIRNSKKDNGDAKNEEREDRISISSEELVEWDLSSVSDFIANQLLEDGLTSDNIQSIFADKPSTVQDEDGVDTVTWSNVDLTKIHLNGDDTLPVRDEQNNESKFTVAEIDQETNNNYILNEKFVDFYLGNRHTQLKRVSDGNVDVGESQDYDETFRDARRNRRSPKGVQSSIISDNDVTWPTILPHYTKNLDSASA